MDQKVSTTQTQNEKTSDFVGINVEQVASALLSISVEAQSVAKALFVAMRFGGFQASNPDAMRVVLRDIDALVPEDLRNAQPHDLEHGKGVYIRCLQPSSFIEAHLVGEIDKEHPFLDLPMEAVIPILSIAYRILSVSKDDLLHTYGAGKHASLEDIKQVSASVRRHANMLPPPSIRNLEVFALNLHHNLEDFCCSMVGITPFNDTFCHRETFLIGKLVPVARNIATTEQTYGALCSVSSTEEKETMLGMRRVFCLAPHPDDIEYAMLGSMIKKKDTQFDIYLFSEGGDFDETTTRERIEECTLSWEGCKNITLHRSNRRYVKDKSHDDWINYIEERFKLSSYDGIFIPNNEDTHFEHRLVHEIGIALTRVSKINVIEYCTPSTKDNWKSNYYIDITNIFEDKMLRLQNFKSQLQKPYFRDEVLASFHIHYNSSKRGIKYVERFKILSLYQ